MKLSSHEEYGVRCLLQLGRAGKDLTIPEISQLEGISTHYVAKLMRMLRKGELVKSTRGQSGGYTLARPAEKISIAEVLTVLGGRFFESDFCRRHRGQESECTHSVDCSIRSLWRTLQGALDRVLGKTTLQDLLRNEEEMIYWVSSSSQFQPVTLNR